LIENIREPLMQGYTYATLESVLYVRIALSKNNETDLGCNFMFINYIMFRRREMFHLVSPPYGFGLNNL
jgi:hypothetical protein